MLQPPYEPPYNLLPQISEVNLYKETMSVRRTMDVRCYMVQLFLSSKDNFFCDKVKDYFNLEEC